MADPTPPPPPAGPPEPPASPEATPAATPSPAATLKAEVARAVIAQDEAIDLALVAIVADGHVLLEGVPGVAKTTMARAFARVLGGEFSRIQFTPDLLPADIVGTAVYRPDEQRFVVVPGPIFANFVLADEINRAPPRTQSALLEAMQEAQVSIENETRPLPDPFLVIATRNPEDHEGTYPLPEASLDRFLVRIEVPYLRPEEEIHLLQRHLSNERPSEAIDQLRVIWDAGHLAALREAARRVHVEAVLLSYVVGLAELTRNHDKLMRGVSPRAVLALLDAARARAVLASRDYVTPDDLRALATPVWGHRLALDPERWIEGETATAVLERILDDHPIPE